MLSRSATVAPVIPSPPRRPTVPFRAAVGPVIVAAAIIALVFPDRTLPYVPVVAGVTIAAFLLIRNSRAFILAPALVIEFSMSDYINPQIHVSARLAMLVVAVVLSLPLIVAAVQRKDPYLTRILVPALVLLTVATLRNLTASDLSYVIKYARYMVTLILTFVVVASVIRSQTDVKRVAWLALSLGLANAAIAVWQHVSSGTAPFVAVTAQAIGSWDGRSLGLSASPVTLAATTLFVAAPCLGLLLTRPARPPTSVWWLWVALAILGTGIYFAYTRSALIGLGGGVVAIALQLQGQRRRVALGAVVGALALYEVLQGTGLVGARYYSSTDNSAATHVVLWTADLQIAFDNALIGIGNGNFKEVSEQYASQVARNISSADASGLGDLGSEEPHNDFLYVWLSWGIVAFAAYLLVFAGALRNLWDARKAGGWTARFAIACSGGLVAYAVNSAFHNYLDSSTLLWLYAGVSVALARLRAPTAPARPTSARLRRRQRARLRRLSRLTPA